MKRKKKVLGVFNGSFLSNLVGGVIVFFSFIRGGHLKKKRETVYKVYVYLYLNLPTSYASIKVFITNLPITKPKIKYINN